ncbi:MAG TPA: dihydrofolate reductase family protein [Gemmatimonadales bacterium]|nr:dihydrofolate reductase family protein [Gemmatimonadales bacterium]
MRKLIVFNMVSLDGYFTDAKGDMSWAHKSDPEWNEFVAGNARGGGELVFGRVTYEMMASFWPTPQALQVAPTVAAQMNQLPKVVFSKSLEKASWTNTRLIKGDLAAETRKLKSEPGDDMVIMGSGTIVAQLSQERLIDEYQVIVSPLVLGQGRTMFEGVQDRLGLKLTNTRSFGNGCVALYYQLVT